MPDSAFFITDVGEIVPVPADQVAGAAQLGWVPASPKQIHDFQLQQKYGSGTEALKAFGEHAASAATLGLSDVVERAAGVSPEAMLQRERANPIASGVGTATGVAAGLLVPGSGPSLIAKAGKATSAAVLPMAEKATASILKRAIATGAGSAVEGAAYGLGQVVHEKALGESNLTAQSALATIGLSGALGGGIGLAGGALAKALGDAAEHAPAWLRDFEGERNLKAAGGIQSDIARLVKQKGRENVRSIGVEARDLGLLSVLSSPESVAEKSHTLLQSTGQEMRALLQEADAKGGGVSVSHLISRARSEILAGLEDNPLQQPAARQLADALSGYEAKFGTPPSSGPIPTWADFTKARMGPYMASEGGHAGAMKRLSVEFAALKEAAKPGDARIPLEALHGMRREISDALYGLRGTQDPFANSYKDALHDLRSLVSQEIDRGIDSAGLASKEWRALNRKYEVASVFRDLADKGMNRAHGNNLVSPTELLGAVGGAAMHGGPGAAVAGLATAATRRYGSSLLGSAARALRNAINPEDVLAVTNKTAEGLSALRQSGAAVDATVSSAPEKIATLSLLERLNQSASNKIEGTISTLVRGGPKAASIGRAEVAAGIAKVFGESAEDAQAIFKKRADGIRNLVNDPEQLNQKLQAQTEDWHEHAPDTAQAMQIATARAVAFLASKLPQTGKPGPLAHEPVPSRAEIGKFHRYYEAVQNPLALLKQAAAGTLTPEAVEAVKVVYPELYARMQQAAIEKLSGAKAVPYKSRLMLTMLLGKDMDGSTLPMAIMANRQTFARAAQQAPRPAPSRSDRLTVANRMLTHSQASAQRRP